MKHEREPPSSTHHFNRSIPKSCKHDLQHCVYDLSGIDLTTLGAT